MTLVAVDRFTGFRSPNSLGADPLLIVRPLDEEPREAWNRLTEVSEETRTLGREQCSDWILKQADPRRRVPAGLPQRWAALSAKSKS